MNSILNGILDNGIGIISPLQQEDYQKELNKMGGVTPPIDPFWWVELFK